MLSSTLSEWPAEERERARSVLGSVLFKLKDFPALEKVQREHWQDVRALQPTNEIQITTCLIELGDTLIRLDKFVEAEACARESLAIREKKFPDDWLTVVARSLLSRALLEQGKHTEAGPLLLDACKGMKQRENWLSPGGKARLRNTLEYLVHLYKTTGQTNQMAEWKANLAESDQAKANK